MPTHEVPHLCGGILFGLLLEARKARRKAKNKLKSGTDCLTAVDVYAGLIRVVTGEDLSHAGRTISKACTLYKTCQSGSGVYVPFTERATIDAFDAAVKTKNPDLPRRMSEFIDRYLNIEKCNWLVRAIIETIRDDKSIKDDAIFLIDYENIRSADDLPYVTSVVLEPFLISVIQYLLLFSPDAESGRATFESWYGHSGTKTEWKLIKELGNTISPLQVHRGLPTQKEDYTRREAPVENLGAAFITENAEIAPDLSLYQDGVFYIQKGIVDAAESFSEYNDKAIRRYLEKISQKYSTVRTLLNPYQQTPVRSIFVCNDIELNINGGYQNKENARYIQNARASDLAAYSKYIIIIGTGGIGKSMMIRHLLLDTIENYPAEGTIPLFLMLKDYDVCSGSLLDYIIKTIQNFSPRITAEYLVTFLDTGKCLLLLDGLDEIATIHAASFERRIEEFIDRFPNNQFIMSSRQHRAYSAFSRFSIVRLRPFTKAQALDLVERLDCSADDSVIKEEFRTKLDESLYNTHRQFAENPLLLTIMYKTYVLYRDIPSKMYLFYRDAYEALSISHDAIKGLKRPSNTGLTADEFADWFSEFCARTYHDEKYELGEDQFAEYFHKLNLHKKHPERHIEARSFRDDLCDNLCLMYFESRKYHFTHRSFQEYFCALYFSKQKDRNLEGIGEFFENFRSRNYGDQTFSMLYDMIPTKIDEFVFVPYLEKLFTECDNADGYWTFLELMYPRIWFSIGETKAPQLTPTSFIYEFIRATYFDAAYCFDSFPRESEFLRHRYVYISSSDANKRLVEKSRIDALVSDVSKEVGWVYDFSVSEIIDKKYLYKRVVAALDDNNFSLKKEYNAARTCLNRLLEKQKPMGQDFFDQLI